MFGFAGKVVMITGAAGNLGRATAEAFRCFGAHLILVGRNRGQLEWAWPTAEGSLLLAGDITNESETQDMVEEAISHYGRVDVLANIAGGFTMGPPLHETSVEIWNNMLDINARSVFLMSQAVLPYMRSQGSGKIINISARAGLEGKANMGPYCVSKSAVITLTETLAAENGSYGINVNCILPGTIDTPENRKAMPNADFSKWVAPLALADVVLFLASDAARAIHGVALPVYGES
jgi:NAD(P)-dependent dehydrogenase (short-subunit alcohol dehydrogenase family)